MFKCNVTVVIRRRERDENDGLVVTESESPALRIECRDRERAGDDPAIRERTEFLIPPPAEVRPGDVLSCDGVDYELDEVRICRDLDDNLVAARCRTVAG